MRPALGALNHIKYFTDVVVGPSSSTTLQINRYGLIFVFESLSFGGWGIFGVNGNSLTKVGGFNFGVDGVDSTHFLLKMQDQQLVITSDISTNNTRFTLLNFASNS